MKSRIFKKVFAALSAFSMAITMTIGANATTYNRATFNTTGGTGGSPKVTCYIYKEHHNATQGTVERTCYGVYGGLNDSDLITNWTAGGYLYTTTMNHPLSGSATSKNNYKAERVATGLSQSTAFITYSLYMNSNSAAFGTSTYNRNGTF